MCKSTITQANKFAVELAIRDLEAAYRMDSQEFLQRRSEGEFSFELVYQHWDHLLTCLEMMADEPEEPVVAQTRRLIASNER